MSLGSGLWRLSSQAMAWLSIGRSRLYVEAGDGSPGRLRDRMQRGARRGANLLMRALIGLIGRWTAIP